MYTYIVYKWLCINSRSWPHRVWIMYIPEWMSCYKAILWWYPGRHIVFIFHCHVTMLFSFQQDLMYVCMYVCMYIYIYIYICKTWKTKDNSFKSVWNKRNTFINKIFTFLKKRHIKRYLDAIEKTNWINIFGKTGFV